MKDRQIVTSLLDTDAYKVTMADMILWAGHEDVQVRYELTNRTAKRGRFLSEYVDVDQFREQMEAVRSLRFQTDELRYLHSLGYIDERLLQYLSLYLDLPMPEIWMEEHDGGSREIRVAVEGRWIDAIWWEIPILSVLNELYFAGVARSNGVTGDPEFSREWAGLKEEGRSRLQRKLHTLSETPRVAVMEFGTRRRFSRWWQEHVLDIMLDTCPHQVSGTSNVALAREFNIKPMGTMAHELFMAYMGIYGATDEGLWNSQRYVLRDWWNRFRGPLSIALTDTVGTDAFFKVFDGHAGEWWGMRQDSGDPFRFGHRAIEFYRSIGVDPRRKMVVFSDGLDIDMISRLWSEFDGRVGMGFGWGTNLTNDLGFDPLSIVVKLVGANGVPVAKLSDNPAKAIGAPSAVERAMRVFDPHQDEVQDCKY